MPRRTIVIPAGADFAPEYWNVAIYRPGVVSAAFHEDDDLWLRGEGLDPDDVEEFVVGDRLVWQLPQETKQDLRLSVAMSRWGELDVSLHTETVEELVITECIAEPRRTQAGGTYGVMHVFVASNTHQIRGAAQ